MFSLSSVSFAELVINPSNGNYTFTQFQPLDHADATDPNDLINLNFGVVISDSDGDTVTAVVRIGVLDDAPVANDDVNTFDTTSGVANGNVITGVNGGATRCGLRRVW